jgi:hypothetical protein
MEKFRLIRSPDGRDDPLSVPSVSGCIEARPGPPDRKGTPVMAVSSRTAALSGLAGIALFDVGWFWDPTPPVDWSNRHLDAYLTTHSNTNWVIAAVLQLLAIPFLWRFGAVVRDRLAAGGASARTVRLAGEAGRAFGITALAFAVCYAVIPFTGVFTSVGNPSGEIYRFWFTGTFSVFIPFATVFVAGGIGAVCAGAFRGRAVPRGLGIAGIPLGVLVLGTFLLPMAGITLWFLVASITLAAIRPAPVGTTGDVPEPRSAPSLPLGVPTL